MMPYFDLAETGGSVQVDVEGNNYSPVICVCCSRRSEERNKDMFIKLHKTFGLFVCHDYVAVCAKIIADNRMDFPNAWHKVYFAVNGESPPIDPSPQAA